MLLENREHGEKIETGGNCENTGKKSFSRKIAMKNSIQKGCTQN